MFSIKKILVPTDFSENASVAYSKAQKLANHYGATVDFIHIIPTMQYYHESMHVLGAPLDMEKDLYPKIQMESHGRVKELMDDYLKPENKGDSIVEIAAKPSREIARFAERGGYDLILMAANGRHESEFLKGSITEKVVRHSKVSVLAFDKANFDELNNILVPTDGSQTSLKALPIAISIALTFGTDITLYHVQELYPGLTEKVLKNPSKSDHENIRDAIYTEMETFFTHSRDEVKLRRGENFESQFVHYEGASSNTINVKVVIERRISAHAAITEYAGDHADMVVMTTHGRSGLAYLFLGSTTEKVAQHLPLPVLTVKPNFDEKPHVTE
jgi:nucleotide-binding universal stress UspA family protein